jgi:hypothetical protein
VYGEEAAGDSATSSLNDTVALRLESNNYLNRLRC